MNLIGVEVMFNATSGFNETLERNRTTMAWFNVTLNDRRSWERPYTFIVNATGLWKVQFLLYKDGILTNQKLHLFIRVS